MKNHNKTDSEHGSEHCDKCKNHLKKIQELEAQLRIDITKLQDALTREAALEEKLAALIEAGGDPGLQVALDDLAVKAQARSDAMQAVIDGVVIPGGTGTAGASRGVDAAGKPIKA